MRENVERKIPTIDDQQMLQNNFENLSRNGDSRMFHFPRLISNRS